MLYVSRRYSARQARPALTDPAAAFQTLHESRSAVSRSKRTATGKLIPKLYHPNAQLRAVSLPPSRRRTKRCSERADVRFVSSAKIAASPSNVPFAFNSRHQNWVGLGWPSSPGGLAIFVGFNR